MALTQLFHALVLVCCLLASVASSARKLSSSGKAAARLDDNRGLAECWDALSELKSCSDEIVVFFVNGQTDIDSECCGAIEVITRNCWPAMLTSLGFTSEEAYILRGYCDASPAPAAAAPPPGSGSGPAPLAASPISPVPAV